MIDIDYYQLSVYRLTTAGILTAWQPHNITASQPYSHTTSTPHYLMSQLYSLTTSQTHSLTAQSKILPFAMISSKYIKQYACQSKRYKLKLTKKLWTETKIDQDHPVRNNSHSSYTFLGFTFFSHKWFQFIIVLQSVSWKKYRPHEWREDFTCTKAKRFFLPLVITPVTSLSSHADCATEYLKCNGNFAPSDWLKGVPRDMFS